MIQILRIGALMLLLLAGCKKDVPTAEIPPELPPLPALPFAKGADVSWVTEMEAAGKKFYTSTGQEKETMALLKDLGMNTIRLRVWVSPPGGWNNMADVLVKARRAHQLGMRIMINFHYSDGWADPGKQNPPVAWAAHDIFQLRTALTQHTTQVLTALKSEGIQPAWVQVGNETNDGMLWPRAKASLTGGMANYAQLVLAGYNAVKSIFPTTRVVVHLANGQNADVLRWNLDGLVQFGAKFDAIGLSLYPPASEWSTYAQQCFTNMQDLVQRYQKEVMLAEVGMPWDEPVACKAFLTDMINKLKQVPGQKGTGILYWEPQCYGNWQGYTLGAFDNSGRPTAAMEAFKD